MYSSVCIYIYRHTHRHKCIDLLVIHTDKACWQVDCLHMFQTYASKHTCPHTQMHTHKLLWYVHMHTLVHTCIHTCKYTYILTHTHTHTHTHIHTYMYSHTHAERLKTISPTPSHLTHPIVMTVTGTLSVEGHCHATLINLIAG
jgi:hypothetical protein